MKINKYRVWDKNLNHFIIPWTGPGYDDLDIVFTGNKWFIFGGGELLDDKYSLQQFTGKLDINKKEIYEGDIVEYQEGIELGDFTPRIGVIKFCNGCFAYGAADTIKGDVMAYFIEGVYRGWKIIGNIYENPELLK